MRRHQLDRLFREHQPHFYVAALAITRNQQQVLIMKLFAGLTHDEIAGIMEASPNTVATWYRRGISRLKELMHADR